MNLVKQLTYIIVLIPFLVSGQSIDSISIKEIDSLLELSLDFAENQEFEKAFEMNAYAEKIAIKKNGLESVSRANCYLNKGKIHFLKIEFTEAEKYFYESSLIFKKLLGKEHLAYAKSLVNLGILYSDLDKYEQAESLFLEVKEIYQKTIGTEHIKYAGNLNNLGLLYKKFGRYDLAEPNFVRAKAIVEKVLGKNHSFYAASLISLASLYGKMGKYEQAEPLYLEAKRIDEETLEKENPKYAITLINLGILYKNMGNFEKAEQFFLDAIYIDEKTIGRNHPDYATNLIVLANLYYSIGKYEKAESIYIASLQIVQNVYGKDHALYATILHNLAGVYAEVKNSEKSEPLYIESKSIREKVLGKQHPDYAMSLHNLAFLYFDMLEYDKAEPLYLESKAILEEVVGKNHPDYAWNLFNLANLYFEQKKYDKAEALYEEAFNRKRKLILLGYHHLSELEMQKYLLNFKEELDIISSYAQRLTHSSRLAEICYDNALFFKGFLLNAALTIKYKIESDTIAKKVYDVKIALSQQLAQEYSKPISDQKAIIEIEEKLNKIEKELAYTIKNYNDIIKQVNLEEIKQKLSIGEAAIEFIRYGYYNKIKTDSFMYAALLVGPGAFQPKIIHLFEEKLFDSILNVSLERRADYVASLYGPNDRGAIQVRAQRKSLYQLIWKPIEADLKDVKTIYYSPAGLLHRINLSAIPVENSSKIGTVTLADKYQLIELISTRQLAVANELKIVNNDITIFGGIEFEPDTNLFISQSNLASRSTQELSFSMIDSTLKGGMWDYLPWSEWEANSINKFLMDFGFNTRLFSGFEGTEDSFKKIGRAGNPSPRVIHIATHGYFFQDLKANGQHSGVSSQSEIVFKMSDHPMLRSGLIMAGGNAAWKGKQTLEGREDGILTAYEISQMNLSNTELVVLSACETGLGDIQGNEGVYGLQRAFKIAGAKYLIMSLWQVPDKQTSLLMTTFYKKWLENKMPIPDAFHAAQKEMRDIGLDPYQWAGFVLVE